MQNVHYQQQSFIIVTKNLINYSQLKISLFMRREAQNSFAYVSFVHSLTFLSPCRGHVHSAREAIQPSSI